MRVVVLTVLVVVIVMNGFNDVNITVVVIMCW